MKTTSRTLAVVAVATLAAKAIEAAPRSISAAKSTYVLARGLLWTGSRPSF